MFNTSIPGEGIYRFIHPDGNICIPNFHDNFILFNEQVMFNSEHARDNALASCGELTPVNVATMRDYGLRAVEKFCAICQQSDIPEMAQYFRDNWTKKRFFWTGNHVSSHFTSYIFERINRRFLRFPLDEYFWGPAREEDLFKFPNTAVTKYDLQAYGLEWESPIEPLKL
jgi:hypothetical protein